MLVLLGLLVLSVLPALLRTMDTVTDAYALTVLATSSKSQVSFNPYSEEGVLIAPSVAVWLLRSFEFPYRSCRAESVPDHCNPSLIAWVGRGLDLGDEAAIDRGYVLLAHFLERGEGLDVIGDDGLAPIHEAILYRNVRYLRVLLEAGADSSVKIDQPNRPADGLDTRQFLALLESREVADFSQVRSVLDHY